MSKPEGSAQEPQYNCAHHGIQRGSYCIKCGAICVPATPAPSQPAAREDRGSLHDLLDLLAVIHRDGGHHTAKVGIKQSVEDAHKVWAELHDGTTFTCNAQAAPTPPASPTVTELDKAVKRWVNAKREQILREDTRGELLAEVKRQESDVEDELLALLRAAERQK